MNDEISQMFSYIRGFHRDFCVHFASVSCMLQGRHMASKDSHLAGADDCVTKLHELCLEFGSTSALPARASHVVETDPQQDVMESYCDLCPLQIASASRGTVAYWKRVRCLHWLSIVGTEGFRFPANPLSHKYCSKPRTRSSVSVGIPCMSGVR
jgi:hypothetical protein